MNVQKKNITFFTHIHTGSLKKGRTKNLLCSRVLRHDVFMKKMRITAKNSWRSWRCSMQEPNQIQTSSRISGTKWINYSPKFQNRWGFLFHWFSFHWHGYYRPLLSNSSQYVSSGRPTAFCLVCRWNPFFPKMGNNLEVKVLSEYCLQLKGWNR